MVRWPEQRTETEPPDRRLLGSIKVPVGQGEITDDPLAAIGNKHQIYSVTRSVMLPRISINKSSSSDAAPQFSFPGGGVNPLFKENMMYGDISKKIRRNSYINRTARHTSPHVHEKSGSSGYSSSHISSHLDGFYDRIREPHDASSVLILDQTPNYVKSIRFSRKKTTPSSGSGSSNGTLNAIPEGKVDVATPKSAWTDDVAERRRENYDSIVDDALLFYTSLNYVPETEKNSLGIQISVTELLVDILKNINTALDNAENTPEDVLKTITKKINLGLETLKNNTEDDMRKLCINLRNCKRVNSVLRAFNNSNSSRSSETDDFYHSPFSTPSSSSAFSDFGGGKVANAENSTPENKTSLRAVNDEKPSVWEQYYGVRAEKTVETQHVVPKPTDVPIFPGGRPEADFTLDVPRSEHLSKKMRQDKKWRFRCRLLTSFLGLVFFLLSVMAVSLMLTRGKRMFGSMM